MTESEQILHTGDFPSVPGREVNLEREDMCLATEGKSL